MFQYSTGIITAKALRTFFTASEKNLTTCIVSLALFEREEDRDYTTSIKNASASQRIPLSFHLNFATMETEKTFKSASEIRKEKKLEAKKLKRKRIEESGGVRPRPVKAADPKPTIEKERAQTAKPKFAESKQKNKFAGNAGKRRFGRVMENVPNTNKPRYSTLSIAVPGSVLLNCQTRELQTQLVGQISRACAIYMVDEVVVFDDQLGGDSGKTTKALSFMAKILQYMECPQYLRRNFFPMHHDLQSAGLLCPLDAPHHVRVGERSKFREGVVLEKDKCPNDSDGKSYVNVGVRHPVEIDRQLPAGIRCTVALEPSAYNRPRGMKGKVVSPSVLLCLNFSRENNHFSTYL